MYLILELYILYMDVWCQLKVEPSKNFHDRQQAAAADEMELSLRVKSSSSVQTHTEEERESERVQKWTEARGASTHT